MSPDGCSLGGACLTRLLALGKIPVEPLNARLDKDSRSIAIFKNKANSRRNGTSLSSQKAKLSEKHIVSRSEEHPGSVP